MDVRTEEGYLEAPPHIFQSGQRAFTLIEVLISLLVLSVSLVTLIALQSSSLQRTLNNQRREDAMLYARRILAAIENSHTTIENQELRESAADLLRKFVPDDRDSPEYLQTLNLFSTHLIVSNWQLPLSNPWKLPPIEPDAVKHVQLSVSWGQGGAEELHVDYFLPGEGDVEG